MEQRSPEWFNARKGRITSSEIHKIMGEKNLSETAKTYLLEKVSEKFGGYKESISNAALEWGTELEPTARNIYQASTGLNVVTCSFIEMHEYYGGSPDALVDPGGTVEFKCPYNSTNHFKHGLINSDEKFKKIAKEYYYQCISHMNVTGAEWCDFVSFDPRVKVEYMMFIYRLHRNEEEIKAMNERVQLAVDYMIQTIEELPKSIVTKTLPETPE